MNAFRLAAIGGAITLLAACGSRPPDAATSMKAARPGELHTCERLEAAPGVVFTDVRSVPAGPVAVRGGSEQAPAHCLVQGRMAERTSTVDGQRYAIGFELRLPQAWNGRFLFQANGGVDGVVVPALGGIGGGGPRSNALSMGFAVVSSDAGHPAPNPRFGLDPQARRDYGYSAVAQLTPVAKQIVAQAYGRPADRSYIAGCSNGGRHAMVAASRLPQAFDGVLAGNPGFHLPRAAVAQLYGAQQYAPLATAKTPQGEPDLQTAFTPGQLQTLSRAVLARCDMLDGLTDGIVGDLKSCQARFNLGRDVPTCTAGRQDSCLDPAQKMALARVFAGARDSNGRQIYSSFPFDPGVSGANWREWKLASPATRDAGAVAFIFSTPPMADRPQGLAFALGFDMDRDAPRIDATQAPYDESAMSFMTPPNAERLQSLRARGGRMIVYHGTGDGVFSSDDTAAWYERVQANHAGRAGEFVRYFPVPGMNHCSGGPSTDQFDMLTALVDWVEGGRAPEQVEAQARGPVSPQPNPEVPANWAPDRTRPLCPYPTVARFRGGDTERATSFACVAP
ncbi:tannase/feruloyl esterase family alpha/beta hydrolase [uncultured Pseudacidovorax sp.]|uniref:tannase/feruloyl esterase family alpha/beta hydrolase n=1 Tax=uncultured Pseudacidovorax sp. TaxID=679313 RepID=UPI0025F6E7AE|nr:tannase/feruloyl esterase family alpha/beta hydrolase [uncultured Pseudacidovorax sp.]